MERSYITKLLYASSKVEAYRIKQELEQKLRTGFKPDEAQDFLDELSKLLYEYKLYKRYSDTLKEFAALIAEVFPV